jgi:AAHS family benzoate transporter-like MFS transporter
MCLLMVYALGSWLPKLMMAAGYSLGSSLMFLLSLNIGAVIGTAGGGILADRFHLKPVIISMLIVGALALVGLGFNSPQPVIYLLVALAGAASIGCSILLYSYVAQYYPLAVRSTGLGWASGIGRVGAIVGPIVIGMLLGMELPHKMNFIAVAIPAIIAAFAVSFIKTNQAEEVAEVPTTSQATKQRSYS